ncbi:N-acetylmuramoyl-L-alanine amidase [Melghirimyces profundicolus]|uniref:N-acetylmuramoyl-L-alanine amidase n=1 Tax=Melghirimyces profundicolus TaxID=1242148 RepID=A0A2T6BC59_9BACL|nr:N-acetylmuramoyl-L-alanine amidase [Melghirimyces profundicolus]PTX53649.1 N-acetylmuramoyl-L-alanine amidase [Melghirimyces profundicolus]
MRRWWKVGVGVGLLTLLMMAPVPVTGEQTPKMNVTHEEVRHGKKADFAKGKLKEVVVGQAGKKDVLTLKGKEKGVYTSPVIESKEPFTDVGAHWRDLTAKKDKHTHDLIRVEVRASKDKSEWTKWVPFQVSHSGPEHQKTKETMADLIYGLEGKYVQYRVTLNPEQGIQPSVTDMEMILLTNHQEAEAAVRKTKTVALGSLLVNKAQAAIAKPEIVSRAEWGADESYRYVNGEEDWPREYRDVTHMVVHHTAGANNDPDPVGTMQDIYYYHAKVNNWGDIGYNAVIGSDGRIYEGRHGKDGEVLTEGVVGAHARGYNYHSTGIALMGTYSSTSIPSHMYDSLIDYLSYFADKFHIDPHATDTMVRDYDTSYPEEEEVETLTGHGMLARESTECPGALTKERMPEIRDDVQARLDADQAAPIIVDNTDGNASKVGSWATGSYGDFYGSNYEWSSAGGSDSFTWNFDILWSGSYKVSVMYSQGSNRATDAPFTVHHANGTTTKEINQETNGGTWVSLGTYTFDVGTGKVVLTDNANDLVVADAIKVEKVNPVTVTVDNSETAKTSHTGTWNTSTNVSGYYGSNYQPNYKGSGADTFTWNLNSPETGSYQVYVHYTVAYDRATNAPYTVHHSGGTTTKRVNQQTHHSTWVSIGTYNFNAGQGKIVLSDHADGYVIADAVRIVKQ